MDDSGTDRDRSTEALSRSVRGSYYIVNLLEEQVGIIEKWQRFRERFREPTKHLPAPANGENFLAGQAYTSEPANRSIKEVQARYWTAGKSKRKG